MILHFSTLTSSCVKKKKHLQASPCRLVLRHEPRYSTQIVNDMQSSLDLENEELENDTPFAHFITQLHKEEETPAG
jgi:hypothetical protein